MIVITIDPGTLTGWTCGGGSGMEDLTPAKAAPTKGRVAEPEYARCGKLAALLHRLGCIGTVPTHLRVAYVVCEGAAGFTKGKHAVRVSNELRGVVKAWCWRNNVAYIEIAPTDLQRFATGRGQVPKDEMLALARSRLNYPGTDDNEADAWWLREWARMHLSGALRDETRSLVIP